MARLKTFFGYYYYGVFFSKPKTFDYDGQTYEYLYHKYNATWRSERAVEVPIIRRFMMQSSFKSILEIGNVLSHYYAIQHTVVDKYETSQGVVNADIVLFQPNERYEIIIAISTFEHIGFDETPRDDGKFMRAVDHCYSLLVPGGSLVITLPIGANPNVDELLRNDQVPFTHIGCLKKLTKSNKYAQVQWDEIKLAKYASPFPNANGVVIGTILKPMGIS